jgi:hypothetical protein
MEIALGVLLGILLGLVSAAYFVQLYRPEHVIALARDGRLWRMSLVDFRSGRAPGEPRTTSTSSTPIPMTPSLH